VGVYFSVDDTGATSERATALGGHIHMPPTSLPGWDTLAAIADPDDPDLRGLGTGTGPGMTVRKAVLAGVADLVIASGPHVLRGMEIYRHHLIAYSPGGLRELSQLQHRRRAGAVGGAGGHAGPGGWFRDGRIVSVRLNGVGRPAPDHSGAAAHLIARLSHQDFGKRGVRVLAQGRIVKRTGSRRPPYGVVWTR
jgi:hypothetical protein